MIEVGAVIFGFIVNSVTELPDVEGRMWRMTYEKNGAELVWLERNDEVKTFVISFKTLPEDDTGVAHILEHSVLSGSGKYPVKSPFDELRKSSLRVFMNAMTGRDRTYYPFSTRNNQDYLNLADVYLDAVFDPNAVKSPFAFWQEGWHYEIDEKSGNLSYNGVVYNEMKGVFADPERAAGRDVLSYLYPDTVYGYDSGGKPEAIPDLTYEKFCAFYKKFYHPSNAKIFLDGKVDLPPVLAKLDGYLKRFAGSGNVTAIPVQKPVFCRKQIKYPSTACEKKTILVDAWSAGDFRDIDGGAALDVLEYYLAGTNESPLKKALLSEGLCEDVQLYWYGYKQRPMVLIVRNTTDEAAAKCRDIIRKTLKRLAEEGLDRKRLHAIINKNEFAERELNSSYPRGLVHFSRAMGQWLYGGDPAAGFDLSGIYSRLRQGVETGLFEKCLRENLVDNPHRVEITCSPDRAQIGAESRRTAEALARKKTNMSASDLEKLKNELRELADYQAKVDPQSAKSSIPALSIADIPATGQVVDHAVERDGDRVIFKTAPTSKGVVYFTAYFPIDDLPRPELAKVPMLARLLTKLPTARRDALSLQTELMSTVGRVECSAVAGERGNFFRVKLAVLASKDQEAMELLKEVLLETRYDDVATLAKIHKQQLLSAERNVRTRGDSIARLISARGLGRRRASDDVLHGLAQLEWLQNVKVDAGLAEDLKRLSKRIFVRDGMVLSCTRNISGALGRFLDAVPVQPGGIATQKTDIAFGNCAFDALMIEGDTGYSGTVAALPDGCAFDGSMAVAAKIVSMEYLYREIREVGGAYGTALSFSMSGLLSCYTYRNPTPRESLSVIAKSGNALRAFAKSDLDLDRFIVSTIAGMDPYRTPAGEAFAPVEFYINNRSFADIETFRKQIIGTKREDLLRIADILDRQLPAAAHFIVGGKRQVKDVPAEKIKRME